LQSQNKKVGTINGLLAACQGQEAKFIIRSLEGKLRIGLAEATVLGCLASAIVTTQHSKTGKSISKDRIVKDLEEGSKIVKAVFSECPNYDMVVPPLLEGGPKLLQETIKLTPGKF
jgi:DNA ligase-1